jgi:hypothetical protein
MPSHTSRLERLPEPAPDGLIWIDDDEALDQLLVPVVECVPQPSADDVADDSE